MGFYLISSLLFLLLLLFSNANFMIIPVNATQCSLWDDNTTSDANGCHTWCTTSISGTITNSSGSAVSGIQVRSLSYATCREDNQSASDRIFRTRDITTTTNSSGYFSLHPYGGYIYGNDQVAQDVNATVSTADNDEYDKHVPFCGGGGCYTVWPYPVAQTPYGSFGARSTGVANGSAIGWTWNLSTASNTNAGDLTAYQYQDLANGCGTHCHFMANLSIDGVCSTTLDTCTAGTFENTNNDTTTQDKWKCKGINGGIDASCTKDKPPTEIPDALCNETCRNSSGVIVANCPSTLTCDTTYNKCRLAANPTSTTCSTAGTVTHGACSATHYSCTTGTSASNLSNTSTWTWACNGSNGGTNASCSENKPINGGWSAWNPLTCPSTCGSLASTKTRTCNNPAPSNGGDECTRVNGTLTTATARTDSSSCSAISACTTTSPPTATMAGDTSVTTGTRTSYYEGRGTANATGAVISFMGIYVTKETSTTAREYVSTNDCPAANRSAPYWCTIGTSTSGNVRQTFTPSVAGTYRIMVNARDNANRQCTGNPFVTFPIAGWSNCSANDDAQLIVTDAPVEGVCGSTLNTCSAGTLDDIADSTTQYFWNCRGSNRNIDASCSQNRVIDGVCNTAHYDCSTGRTGSTSDNTSTWTWACNGSNGGTNASCSQNKVVAGTWSTYTCPTACGSAASTITRTCSTANTCVGSADVSCSETSDCASTAINGIWSTPPSACSAVCGGGYKYKYCTNPAPSGGGADCVVEDTSAVPDWEDAGSPGNVHSEKIRCNTQACPFPWIQTSGGSVHSNTSINTQPAP